MKNYGQFAEISISGSLSKRDSKTKSKIQSGEFTDESEVKDYQAKNDKVGGTISDEEFDSYFEDNKAELESRMDTLIQGRE